MPVCALPGRDGHTRTALAGQNADARGNAPRGRAAHRPLWHHALLGRRPPRRHFHLRLAAKELAGPATPTADRSLAITTPTHCHVNRQPQNDTTPSSIELEAQIAAAIDPWLAHMSWRKDFEQWRERRIRQEEHQQSNLLDIRAALGTKIAGKTLLDLGAGMGGLSVAVLLELGPKGLALQAMDYNPDYCNIARLRAERYGLELPIVAAAGESLPYPNTASTSLSCFGRAGARGGPRGRADGDISRAQAGRQRPTTVPNRQGVSRPALPPSVHQLAPRPWPSASLNGRGTPRSGSLLQDRQQLSD